MTWNAVRVDRSLEPCPFCGGPGSTQTKQFKRIGDLPGKNERQTGKITWVGCWTETCWQPRVHGVHLDHAREQWNRRRQADFKNLGHP